MAKPHELLASSLNILKEKHKGGRTFFKTSEFSRVHRERLQKNGFLKEVVKGWLMVSNPEERAGESTSWYANFWEFCGVYCSEKFGEIWCLSPEQSLKIHAESTVIPSQIIIHSSKGGNNLLQLPFQTSIYDLKTADPETKHLYIRNGLRLYTLEYALIKASPSFYKNNPLDAQICLTQVKNISPLLGILLEGGNSTIAGRLAAAFTHIGQKQHADSIASAMTSAGYIISQENPFHERNMLRPFSNQKTPAQRRIKSLWEESRKTVLEVFRAQTKPPCNGFDIKSRLTKIEDIYQNDAYHSLSIEGYQVNESLIHKVATGDWDPLTNPSDRENKNALAARGYWQAFQLVLRDLKKCLEGADVNREIKNQHTNWYRELFQPSVQIGLIPAASLSGYRQNPVYLRNSRHIPPRSEIVFDMMDQLFEQLKQEESSIVKAVLCHWIIGYVHPFPDGNGRIARFAMNMILSTAGYPWTVIKVDHRNHYLKALESASVHGDIKPFTEFIKTQMNQQT